VGPSANRRERRALGIHALARDAEILAGAGEAFPRAVELFEICRTFGTLPKITLIVMPLAASANYG
jgi:hypothetical protein